MILKVLRAGRNRHPFIAPSLSHAAGPRHQRRVPAVFFSSQGLLDQRHQWQFQFRLQKDFHQREQFQWQDELHQQQQRFQGQPLRNFQRHDFKKFQFRQLHQSQSYLIRKRRFQFFELQQFLKSLILLDISLFQSGQSYLIRKR